MSSRPLSKWNGQTMCPLTEEWENLSERALAAERRLKDIDERTKDMITHLGYLQELKHLGSMRDSLEHMNQGLLGPATSKDHLNTKTATLVFKILGGVIFALLIVLGFLLTGEQLGWIGQLHR